MTVIHASGHSFSLDCIRSCIRSEARNRAGHKTLATAFLLPFRIFELLTEILKRRAKMALCSFGIFLVVALVLCSILQEARSFTPAYLITAGRMTARLGLRRSVGSLKMSEQDDHSGETAAATALHRTAAFAAPEFLEASIASSIRLARGYYHCDLA